MNIYGYTFAQLEQYLLEIGEKSAKAPFITKGLYRPNVSSFSDMKDVKKSIIQRMETDFEMILPEIVEHVESEDSVKFLFELSDGNIVEAVLMRQQYGNSLCVSTQVGCNMGCTFCQSGRQEKIRNLETWEMTAQLIAIEQRISMKISNVVLMGIGEPFDNYDNIMNFISILNNPHMINIGKRHISTSTCGIVPRIYDYMNHPNAGLLAVSLHAPNDNLRNQLMPVNRAYPLEKLMEALDAYISA
ncbi:MAG: 23S rRNA (adenine(2503)-C(2))-methyltransferase RlmN, partial [Proteocatella sp.]